MAINPMEIKGNWDKGFVLDFHVLSSTPIGENIYGHMEFDTVRTELGELVYQLKYRGRYENVDKILDLIKATRPHNILLIDDLYSTGETINECVSVLKADPLLKNIYVLLMTRTR